MLRIIESQSFLSRSINLFVMGRACRSMLTAATLLGLVAVGQQAHAAPIVYGSFAGTTVDYLSVTEDANSAGDVPPLFGEPTTIGPVTPGYPAVPCVLCAIPGNSLDFDPTGFGASATGAAGIDLTDGNLTFTVVAHPGKAISVLELSEAGDLTLAGVGTDATSVSVTAVGVLNVLAVDGVGLFPTTISVPFSLTFTPSGTFGLVSDGGASAPFPFFSDWSGFLSKNIEQILIDNSVSYTLGATQISVNLDNTLTAQSENGTVALIAKKEFGGLSVTVETIPEPATWLLLAICGMAVGATRRSR